MSMNVFTFKHRPKVEQAFRILWRVVEGVGPDQGVPREISGRRGLIKNETSVIH